MYIKGESTNGKQIEMKVCFYWVHPNYHEIDDDNEYAKAHDIAFFIAEAKNPKSFQPKESYPQLELVKDIHNCDAIKN